MILPTQNPDGREADSRRNAYGFDMNRDWFARTQPETDAKVEFLRQYPPVLFIDAHEMGNTGRLLLPAQRRPDLPRDLLQAVGLDQRPLRPGDAGRLRRPQDRLLQLRDVRPLLPGLRRHGARHGVRRRGHDVREDELGPDPQARLRAVPDAVDVALAGRGEQGRDPRGWRKSWVDALAQGQAGVLEPNQVVQPENEIQQEVPDLTVRQYFLRADEPSRAREVQSLVRRLQRMDVEVRRLTAPARRPRLHRVRPRHRPGDAPGRDVRGLDGPAPEALGAGDAQRGHVRPVPVLLRRHGLEPAAALRRRWRLLRRVAGDEHRAGGAGRRAGVPGAAARSPVGRAVLDVAARSRAASSPRAGCAGCSTSGASPTRT